MAPSSAKYEAGHDKFSLCYNPTDGNLERSHEDAIVDVQWGVDLSYRGSRTLLIWRLTGVEWSTQTGSWEAKVDDTDEWQKSTRAVVTGIPEAMKAFCCPLDAVTPVAGVNKTQ